MTEIKVNPTYNPIDQLPYCCVPCSLSMILDRRNISHGTQEEIGYELGLTVPEKFLGQFPNAQTIKPTSGYGTQVQNEKYSINNFFERKGINLHQEYFFIEPQFDTEKFIIDSIKENKDLIICFNYNKLYGHGGDRGHVSLIESIKNKEITLIEPEINQPKRKIVKIENLIKSIKHHGKNNYGGFWRIS